MSQSNKKATKQPIICKKIGHICYRIDCLTQIQADGKILYEKVWEKLSSIFSTQ
jgi:hypothetical protein